MGFATFLERKHWHHPTAIPFHSQTGKLIQVEESEQTDVYGIQDAPRQAGGRPQPDENEAEWREQDGREDRRLPGIEPVI
jgi:hypothetical protein